MKNILLLLSLVFCLSACTDKQEEFRFAVVTDLHLNKNADGPKEDLQRTIEHLNLRTDLDFVLVTGDISEAGDKATMDTVKAMLDQLKVKYYVVSGNHETKWSESGSTDFADIFGSENFEFDHKGLKFLGFRTGPVIRMMDGHVAPQDITWLDDRMAVASKNQPAILVTHYPMLPTDVDNWYDVTDAVRKYNIKAFVGGHYHSNRLFNYDGIPAFICRSNLRDKADGIGGYSVMDVTSDSIIVHEQKIGQEERRWGAYSLTETYYTADNSGYERPDFSVNEKYSQVKNTWKTKNNNAILASPIIDAEHAYVGDDMGIFNCYSLKDGAKVWSFETKNRIVGTADVAQGIVVFGSADKNIYALDATTGKLIWNYKASEAVLGSAKIEGDIAYIGASDGKFRALDIKSGKLVWEYDKVKGYIETRPLVYEGKVIFGAWDDHLYALNAKTGAEVWKWADGRRGVHFSPAAVWPAAANGKIFVTAPDRIMSAIDSKTGKTVWRSQGEMVRETVAVSADNKRVYSKTMQDNFVCYSAEGKTSKLLWKTDVQYGYDHSPSMPVEKNGIVFCSTKNGIIFAIEGKTGELLWKHKVGNSIITTVCPLNSKEIIYAGGEGIVGKLTVE